MRVPCALKLPHRAKRQPAAARHQGGVMYVISIHSVSDPQAFWSGQLPLPEGTELPLIVPSSDGSKGVCVFKTDSVDTVRNLVDGLTSQVSRNEFYAINETNAQGLPG
jgi:hypothetical protein